jgi:hypothetical protein
MKSSVLLGAGSNKQLLYKTGEGQEWTGPRRAKSGKKKGSCTGGQDKAKGKGKDKGKDKDVGGRRRRHESEGSLLPFRESSPRSPA